MAIDKIFDGAVDGIADNLFNSVSNSVSEVKAMQQRKAAENVQLVVQALKKIDADIREKYDGVTTTIEQRVASIKDGRDGIDGKHGRDGINGKDGRDGKDGRNGRDGATGPRGFDGPKGLDGKDGQDGEDGVSVEDAHIDFDGSLIITLSSGRVINVGEVVAADIAEKIKVITNGGGTSQPVLDELASLQAQIDLISSALVYKGTWDATTNTPTLTSSAGTANTFYIVSVAGTTTLNGISNWGVGDWAVYNGSVWQRIEGGAVGNFTDLSVSGTTTLSGLTASTALALNASKEVVSVTNTGSGNNVLATSPTLTTPVLGTPSSVTLTNATGLPLSTGVTGTLPIANGGTGQTTANAAFNALAPSQTSNSGKYLTTNGTNTSWATLSGVGTVTSVSGTGTVNGLTLTGTVTSSGSLTLGGTLSGIANSALTNSSITINGSATSLGGSINVGTVTSVGATVPSFLSIAGSPVTSSGTLAITLSGTALPTTSGGTGLTSFTTNGLVYASSTSALATGSALTFDGSKLVNTGYNKSSYQVSVGGVGSFEASGGAYLSYASGANLYSMANGSGTEDVLNLRASAHLFYIGGTEQMRLNSSGSLTLGVALSSWGTPYRVIQLGDSTSSGAIYQSISGGTLSISSNEYISATGPRYTNTAPANRYLLGNGSHSWYTAASGTANDLISYTQAMTLDSSGNLFVNSLTASKVVFTDASKNLTSTGTVNVDQGGTGLTTTPANGALDIGNGTGFTRTTLTAGSGVTITNASGSITINATGTGGDVVGPASATDNAVARFDGTTGKLIQNGVVIIGDTGAVTGVTDLTASGSVTLSGGTANGVAYLNGSKVVTSGSALTFDGSALGVGGKLRLIADSPFITGANITSDANSLAVGTGAGGSFVNFFVNNSEVGRFTSTGLGIGTSSPSFRLDVQAPTGVIKLTATTGTNASYFRADNSGGIVYFGLDDSTASTFGTAGAYGTVIQRPASTAFNINRAGTVDFYISTTGNVGIGTSSPQTKLHVAQSASGVLFGQDSTTANIIGTNAAGTSSQGLFLKGFPLTFTGSGGGGTAQMTLNGDGNLGLGVTPSAWNSSFRTMQLGNSGYLFGRASQTQMEMGNNAVFDATDTRWEYITTNTAQRYLQDGSSGSHQWFTAPSGTAGDAITFTQALTLDASGNLNLGTTSNAGAIRFKVLGAASQYAGYFEYVSSGYGLGISNITNNTSSTAIYFFNTNGAVGSITTNGSATAYNTSSDYRLKNTIAPMTGALAKVAQLKPVTYKWNADGSDGEGFIAHELAEVVPQCVTGEKDAVDENGNPKYQGIDTSFLVATLTAAIQELKAEFDAYKASHP